jgi:hypothetical protein
MTHNHGEISLIFAGAHTWTSWMCVLSVETTHCQGIQSQFL